MIPAPRLDISAKVIASSICAVTETRIDTLQLRYPRIVHAEFMTHRTFSRNASSSRAIPTTSLLVRDADIFVPTFRRNKPGMQPGDLLTAEQQADADAIWRDMAAYVTAGCRKLADKTGLDIAKQWSNRPLEWFGYIDVVVSSTDWANWDHLRDHDAAQDEIRVLCRAMKEARDAFFPTILAEGEWHLPYINDDDRVLAFQERDKFKASLAPIFTDIDLKISVQEQLLLIVSAARCCRVSYSKHDGTPSTFGEDIERFLKLVPTDDPVHATPVEHQAMPLAHWPAKYQGNFRDFAQFRQFVPHESISEP